MANPFDEAGRWWGYPECCREVFLLRFAIIQATGRRQPTIPETDGTGFIPCVACQAKIKAMGLEKYVAENISPNRQDRCPFPEESGLGP